MPQILITILLGAVAIGGFFFPQYNIETPVGLRTDSAWNDRTTYLETAFSTGRNILINGTSKYLNFNTTSGSTGYGIRDNGGNIECKNSGGAWGLCGTGGGGGGLNIQGTASIGNIPYFNTTATSTAVATSTALVTCSGSASCGTGSYVIGNPLTITATGGGGGDPFTHPASNQSATTSLMLFNGNATSTGLTVTGSTYLATTGGNVGIGTTSPYEKLSVAGKVVADSFNATSTTATSTFAGSILGKNLGITGLGGNGFLTLIGQSANSTSPTAGSILLHAITENGFTRLERDNESATNIVYGRDNIFIAKNESGVTINKGQVVYTSGTVSNVPQITKARANSAGTLPAIGVAAEAITHNSFGSVMYSGVLTFDTSVFSDGNNVWVSPTTAGDLTSTRPSGTTNYVQRMGTILVSGNSTTGKMLVQTSSAVLNMETGTNAPLWTATNASTTQLTTTGSAYFATTNGKVGIGTTTPGTLLSLGDTGANTINISATATSTFGTGIDLRTGCFAINGVCISGGAGGNVVDTLASTLGAGNDAGGLSMVNLGNVGIGTTSPYSLLSISNSRATAANTPLFTIASTTAGTATTTLLQISANGNFNQTGNYTHFGPNTFAGTCTSGTNNCLEFVGNDNSINGAYVQAVNVNSGTSAWTGYSLNNNLADTSFLHYGGVFLNSSTYTDTSFGTANAVANLLNVQNTDGPIMISAGTTTSVGYINFNTGGSATTNERMRISSTGNVGIGTTSPFAKLSVAGNGYFDGNLRATNITATGTLSIGGVSLSGSGTTITGTGVSVNFQNGIAASAAGATFSIGYWKVTQTNGNAIWTNAVSGEENLQLNGMFKLRGTTSSFPGITNTGSVLNFMKADNSANASFTALDGVLSGNLGIGTATSTFPTARLYVQGETGSTTPIFTVASSTGLVHMTVLENGNVGIGTTSPWKKLSVDGTVSLKNLSTDSTVGLTGAICLDANNELKLMSGAGTCVTSSEDYKKNIQPLTGGLDWVMRMNPILFDYKDTNKSSLGFSAEEMDLISPLLTAHKVVQTVVPKTETLIITKEKPCDEEEEVTADTNMCPYEETTTTTVDEIVNTPTDIPYTVRYELLPAVLVKAIQELNAKIDKPLGAINSQGTIDFYSKGEVDQKISDLQKQIDELKAQLNKKTTLWDLILKFFRIK